MLKKLHSMEENLDSLLNDRVTQKALNESQKALNESQKALNESLKVQARRKTVEIESLKAQVRRQGDEIDAHETCIQIFSDDRRNITLPIRVRFFRVYQRDFMDMNVDVKAGNDAAHGGALKMDVRVFMELEMGEQDYAAFERLYGMSVGTALRFTDFVLIRDVLSKLAGHAAAGDDRPFVTALRTDFIETILRSSNEEIARAIADEDSIIQDLSRAISNIRIRRG
ncbi:MAG: hypothetical protein M1815_002911 [Lichina confinis]|nr:MAG: hypothetical protein M1815_002911 [Lichina confinis]